MVVRVGRSELVDHRHVRFDVVRVAVEEAILVDRSAWAALSGSAVVGAVQDQRVLELSRFLEILDEPADLDVRVLRECGVDLGHAAEELLLIS